MTKSDIDQELDTLVKQVPDLSKTSSVKFLDLELRFATLLGLRRDEVQFTYIAEPGDFNSRLGQGGPGGERTHVVFALLGKAQDIEKHFKHALGRARQRPDRAIVLCAQNSRGSWTSMRVVSSESDALTRVEALLPGVEVRPPTDPIPPDPLLSEPVRRSTAAPNPTVWCVRPGRANVALSQFTSDSVIGVGWNELGDLRDTANDLEALKTALRRTYPDEHAESAAGTIRRFLNDIAIGDLIVTPGGGVFHLGRVVGEPEYDPNTSAAFKTTRRVSWVARVERDRVSAEYSRLGKGLKNGRRWQRLQRRDPRHAGPHRPRGP
jgi:hypothetical protein